VHLEGVPVDGDYWVLELGPATYGDEGYYQYAIVSDSKSASLFVLARDVDTYYSEYDAHVSASLEAKGFNEVSVNASYPPPRVGLTSMYLKSYNSPIPLSHEGCTYSEYAYAASGVATNPDTVGQLVVDEYLGRCTNPLCIGSRKILNFAFRRWYQMYASPSVYATFESNATCVTADYGLNENGTISVYNVDSEGSPSGPYEIINGYAYQINAEIEPGKLVVHFDTSPTDAPYWILALGPANADGLYDWSVVSDPLEATLFILARDVETFRTEYEDDVLALVEDLGFTKDYNKPVETVQDGCTYIEEPSA
jgi:apolipoprotein D and lipocalin family protein